MTDFDAVVIGAGPNGLAAAITLAEAGCRVQIVEAADTVGGGARSAELTLPGYIHDVCSAVHPLGVASPFFRRLPLELEWCYPEIEAAHPLPNGDAAYVMRSMEATAASFGVDAGAYKALMGPLVDNWQKVLTDFLRPITIPKHPLMMAQFGLRALPPAKVLAKTLFKTERARAAFAGMAAHAIMPLERAATSAFGLMLMMLAHAVGWPMAKGGSQQIADALTAYLESLGGQVVTGRPITSLHDLSEASAYLFDVSPKSLVKIAGERFPQRYINGLKRYRYGPGVFKLDMALSEPVPWRNEAVRKAGTVHVGGPIDELARAEREAWVGTHPEKPFVLAVQHSVADPTRAPEGHHTLWAYCHVPNGSERDMTDAILNQIERFAPGFRDTILHMTGRDAAAHETYNPNYVGGDINNGVQDLFQLFTRPVPRLSPYTTPDDQIYLCSSATPPGGGVHGMCGVFAAKAALRRL